MEHLPLLDELLVVVSAILLAAQLYSIRMLRILRARLDGSGGEYLLRVVSRFGYLATLAQFLTLGGAILRQSSYDTTADVRLTIFFAVQTIIAVAFIWTVWEIHHLPADGYGQNSSAERPEPCECLCKQIDDAISTASTVVDQCDNHAQITT